MKLALLLTALLGLVISIQAQDYSDYTKCAEQDSLALVEFYNATDGPNWTCNQDGFSIDDLGDNVKTYYTTDYPNAGMGKWLEGPVKDWFGVLLEKQTADDGEEIWRVVHLRPTISRRSAGNNNLSGYVPHSVGMLTALEWFKVNGNSGLQGTEIPDEIYHSTLESLDVEAVYFSGIISDAIKNCTKLGYTNLRYNYFDSIPTMDFYDDATIEECYGPDGKIVFFYDSQLTYANLEPTVEFFLEKGIKYEARNMNDVGRASEIVVSEGDAVTLTCNDAGENGEVLSWYMDGFDMYSSGNTYSISSVAPADTGNYYARIWNEYVRGGDQNQDYGEGAYTKKIHLTFIPSKPTPQKAISTINGKKIEMEFSKPMRVPLDSESAQFSVISGDKTISVESISRGGRLYNKLILNLSESIVKGESVQVQYAAGTVACSNGGVLDSFTKEVSNRTGVKPNLVSAQTRTDGNGIELYFDYFIDVDELNVDDFILTSTSGVSISSIVSIDGDIDDDITKGILITTSQSFLYTDEIVLSFEKEAVFALYGAGIDAVTDYTVTNNVIAETTPVLITVIDGTKQLENIVVKGDLSIEDVILKDDASQGDETADDHTWSMQMELTDGDYNWNVYKRSAEVRYDTVTVDLGDGETGEQLNPYLYNVDSLLTEDVSLSFTITDEIVTGDTIFGYKNNTLTLRLDLESYLAVNSEESADPYVMGINDDWTTGIAMDVTEDQYIYVATVEGLAAGDEVSYIFRNGDDWENNSLELRSVTVNRDTTVTASFGDAYDTAVDTEFDAECYKVYPNPVKSRLYFMDCLSEKFVTIDILDLRGHILKSFSGDVKSIDLSSIPKGVYILRMLKDNKLVITTKLVKQ